MLVIRLNLIRLAMNNNKQLPYKAFLTISGLWWETIYYFLVICHINCRYHYDFYILCNLKQYKCHLFTVQY